MSTARPAGVLVQSGRGLVEWLTGTGFLTLNALCFFGALVTLIPWNIYSSPGDFWSADILVRWAFLLGLHALLVGTWSLIQNVILRDDNPVATMTPAARQWHTARIRNTASSIDFRTGPAHSPAAAATASTLYAEAWARSQREQVSRSAAVDDAGEVSEPVVRSEAVQVNDLLADWDTSWPEPVQTPTPTRGEELIAPAEETPLDDVDILIESLAPERTPGPLSAAARATSVNSTGSTVDPEMEWQWIEAAASSWLSRREHESGADARSN